MNHINDQWPLTPVQTLAWTAGKLQDAPLYHLLRITFDQKPPVEGLEKAWGRLCSQWDIFQLRIHRDEPGQSFDAPVPSFKVLTAPPTSEFQDSWTAAVFPLPSGLWALEIKVSTAVCDQDGLVFLARELSSLVQGTSAGPAGSMKKSLKDCLSPVRVQKAAEDDKAWQQYLQDAPPGVLLLGEKSKNIPYDPQFLPVGTPAGLTEQKALTVLFAWLYRLSGQKDLLLSWPRPSQIDGPNPGPWKETAFLRVQFDEGETFETLDGKVARSLEFAARTSIASLGAESHLSGQFDLVRSLPSEMGGLKASWTLGTSQPLPSGIPQYLYGSQEGTLVLDAGVYDQDQLKRLQGYFETLTKACLKKPGTPLVEVSLLSSAEKELLGNLGKGRRAPAAPSLLDSFAQRVRETPDVPAVEFEGRVVTYQEFDRLTNRCARLLQSQGITKGARVAVAMPRGLGEITALLGVLKAGAAYVPLDPTHPVDRVRVILEDAHPQVLLAPPDSPLKGALPGHVIDISLDPHLRGLPEDARPLEDSCGPADLAYILFTSGSTGRPKGVEIPRGAFANFLQSMAHEPGLKPGERIIALTTTTFDIAGLEIFLPLYVGGTVVVADKETASDPDRLKELFDRGRISVMQATPATWRLLLDAGWNGAPDLRMLCGGEAMSMALAQRLTKCGKELWNVYGPTETTVWSTLELIPRDVTQITIGHPIDNTGISLRSDQGLLVPYGTIGEICISGDGLALGYFGRPDLTLDRFPVDRETGERYYRTGDLGRFTPDGRLECLGRVDHQVKIRGFRIEPADIEAQLRGVPGVQEVLVIALSKSEGDPLLVAYWVGTASRDTLVERAKAALPPYMVPSAWVSLESFPLSTSGKIDRKKLPPPEAVETPEESGTGPRTPHEELMAVLWKEILGLSFVPVDRDFFTLGGTSIRAIALRKKIKEAFGLDIPLKILFEQPTVEALVSALGKDLKDDGPIVSTLGTKPGLLPWIGLMGIQLYEDIAKALPQDQGLLAMHIPVKYRPGIDPLPSVEELGRLYAQAIRQKQPRGPYKLFGFCHGGVVAFEAACQLAAEGEEIERVVVLDADLPSAKKSNLPLKSVHYFKKLVMNPGVVLGKLKKGSAEAPPTPAQDVEPVDIPFIGPELEEDLARWEQRDCRVHFPVVSFRASANQYDPWITMAPDLGWGRKTSRLETRALPANHLGILQGEFGAEIARTLVQQETSAGESR